MDVVIYVCWQIKVDDVGDMGNVQSSGSDISGDQHWGAS